MIMLKKTTLFVWMMTTVGWFDCLDRALSVKQSAHEILYYNSGL